MSFSLRFHPIFFVYARGNESQRNMSKCDFSIETHDGVARVVKDASESLLNRRFSIVEIPMVMEAACHCFSIARVTFKTTPYLWAHQKSLESHHYPNEYMSGDKVIMVKGINRGYQGTVIPWHEKFGEKENGKIPVYLTSVRGIFYWWCDPQEITPYLP